MSESRRPERRISHPEDLMFWDGAQGAIDAMEALLNPKNYDNCTIKWDGSPSIMFGRNLQGEFVLTDKHGFDAKRYEGRPTSPKGLSDMILSRGPEHTPERLQYVKRITSMWPALEKAIPRKYRGYINADVMYFSLKESGQNFVFEPNTVTYYVAKSSAIGKVLAKSNYGIACHYEVDANSEIMPSLKAPGSLMGRVFAFAPTPVQGPPRNLDKYDYVKMFINDSSRYNALSEFLDLSNHKANQISDLGNLMYRYVNGHVGKSPDEFGHDFINWITKQQNITDGKKSRIFRYIDYHTAGFNLAWKIYGGIASAKNQIITDLEKQDLVPGMKSFVAGKPGSEGFVMDTAEAGQIKLVKRNMFTLANQQKNG